MQKGTIEQIGTPREIYEQPASLYVAGFVGSPAMNFLPGRIDGGARRVVLDSGARIDLPFALAPDRDGLLVQVGFRPERISIARGAEEGLTARFEFAEELGSGCLYHLLHEDIPLTVQSGVRHSFATGQAVRVTIPAAALHLFDAATTLALPLTAPASKAAEPV
jgi:ABC-type sugar transport system ATPase subunit